MANVLHFDKAESLKTGLLLTFFLLLSLTHCTLISKDGDKTKDKDAIQIPHVVTTTPPPPPTTTTSAATTSSTASLNAVRFHTQNDEEQITSIMGVAAALTSSGTNGDPSFCNSTKRDTCWEKVPPLPGIGIPSSREEVDAACK